jgi:hypothetical protein
MKVGSVKGIAVCGVIEGSRNEGMKCSIDWKFHRKQDEMMGWYRAEA